MANRGLFTSLCMLFVVLGCGGNDDKKPDRSGRSADLEAQVCDEACACSDDDECESECRDDFDALPRACNAQKEAFLRCASKAKWACEDGEGAVEDCDDQFDALERCESEGEPIADVPTRDASISREDAGPPSRPRDVDDAGTRAPGDADAPIARPASPPAAGAGGSEPLACESRANDSSCASCWKDSCCQSFSACMTNAACRDLVSCVSGCTGAQRDACFDACAAKSPGGVGLLTSFLECSAESCQNACG